jgi:D-glycero-D-manno-heptose 1,7-bisphosphate phosphatase
MPATTPRPAVFVDRDNTLIEDPGYLCDPDEVRLQPGAAAAVARLRAAGYPVIVVTNQSGIARGLLTEAQLADVHQRMQDLLHAHGTGVDAIYYCPHLDGPEAVVDEYRRESDLRKPAPGMLLHGARDLNIELDSSWMVGDSERDMQAGQSAGCRTILLVPKGLHSEIPADFVAADLAAAADIVLEHGIAAATDEAPPPDDEAAAVPAAAPAVDIACQGPAVAAVPALPTEQPAQPNTPALDAPPAKPAPAAVTDDLMRQILEELRSLRRQQQHRDFSVAKLAAAVAQAFALCAVAWGLYSWIGISSSVAPSTTAANATLSLLAGIVFQVMALTFFSAADKK